MRWELAAGDAHAAAARLRAVVTARGVPIPEVGCPVSGGWQRVDEIDLSMLHPVWYSYRAGVEYIEASELAYAAADDLAPVLWAVIAPLAVEPPVTVDGRAAVRVDLTVDDAEALTEFLLAARELSDDA